jgi:hypothetical protein
MAVFSAEEKKLNGFNGVILHSIAQYFFFKLQLGITLFNSIMP